MKKSFVVKRTYFSVLDFLSENLIGIGKSALIKQLKAREIRVNGRRIAVDISLEEGDEVSLFLPAFMEGEAPIIVYADDNIVIADKPAGVDSQYAAAAFVAERFYGARLLHRLDRNTSGLLVFALNDTAYNSLYAAFKEGRVTKIYRAEVTGEVVDGIYKAYLFKDAENALCRVFPSPGPGRKLIKTGVRTVERGSATKIDVTLFTGRTHQIRAHLKYLGWPIVGDGKYGEGRVNRSMGVGRQRLRAYKLIFSEIKPPLSYLNGKVFEIAADNIDYQGKIL